MPRWNSSTKTNMKGESIFDGLSTPLEPRYGAQCLPIMSGMTSDIFSHYIELNRFLEPVAYWELIMPPLVVG